uniref:CSD domain-containing protein n=1 Tax=viral metagenome TaxID=1070528 RepID=A0A6C0I7R4_9ZZZZ
MSDSSAEKFTGRVKWFNNKAGYGFITVTDGPKSGSDVFVHHSSIKVDSEQYKYLVQGEYIEFSLSTVASDKHECQATEVSGIKGGKLMCETRNETRTAFKKEESSEPVKQPRSKRVQDAPKEPAVTKDASTDGEWTRVGRPISSGGRGPAGRGGRGPQRGSSGRGGKRDTV